MPKLARLRIRGVGPFVDEVDVNLDLLAGPLVALCGENGEGKTFFLESWLAAMHRKFATRGLTGQLKEVATSRDAVIEAWIVNGSSYRIQQTIDAKTGDGNSLVTDADGNALNKTGGITEYKAWAKTHLPAREVLECSIFGVQGKLGFLDLDPGDRKGVLLRVLGHEHLEKKSKAAGKRADKFEVDLKAAATRAADERARGANLDHLTAQAEELAEKLPAAETELTEARDAKERAQADLARVELAEKAADDAAVRRDALADKIAKADKTIADNEARVLHNRDVLADADKIRAAVARLPVATSEQTEATAALSAIDEKARAITAERKTTEETLRREREALAERTKTIAEQERRLGGRAAVDDAIARLPERKAAFEAKAAEHAATLHELEELRQATLQVSGRRIVTLRDAHETIVQDDEVSPREVSKSAIADDDSCTHKGDEAPKRIAELSALAATQKRAVDGLRVEVQSLELTAAKKEDLDAISVALVSLRAKEETAKEEVSRLEIAVHDLPTAPDRTAAKARLDALATEIKAVKELAAKLVPLTNAETRIAELEPVIAQSRAAAAEARAELLALAEMPLPIRPDVDAIAKRFTNAEAADRKLRADIAATKAALEAAEVSRARLSELETAVSRLEEELSDWRLLHQDLGRDGIQALEIDGVGPELTEIANELLRTCYGTRFMVEISTTRPKAAGDGDKEGCWVLVTDLMKQRTSEAKTFSGGERVLIAEAVNLAILAIVCKKTGDREPTIVRDETPFLSADKSEKYVAMLRRAAGMLGASKVLYVTHDRELQALADSRLLFSNGTVRAA